MRALLTGCFAALVLSLSAASAQQATSGQTMTVYVSIPTSTDGGVSYKTTTKTKSVISELIMWATSTGQPSYSIKPGSTRYTGDTPEDMQHISAADLNTLIAKAAVEQGVSLGYNSCGATGIQTRVVDESSVSHNFSIRCGTAGTVATQESVTSNAGTIQ